MLGLQELDKEVLWKIVEIMTPKTMEILQGRGRLGEKAYYIRPKLNTKGIAKPEEIEYCRS